MNIVHFENIKKVYHKGTVDIPALRGITFDVTDGEFVAIMGASGSGKSTLLHLIGCLDRPSEGRYVLADEDVSTLDDDNLSLVRNRKIGFVFQSFNLIPQLTVIENIEVPLFYMGVPRQDRIAKSVEMAKVVGLEKRVGHKSSELSGGQCQRVAIARALVTDPVMILADEPTGNLDSTTGKEIMEVFAKLHDSGKTIIMVTHEDHIAEYAARRIILHDGVIVDQVKQ